MAKQAILILSIILFSCKSGVRDRSISKPIMSYFRDADTNLCFAILDWSRGITITNVPCNEQVEKLLKWQNKP